MATTQAYTNMKKKSLDNIFATFTKTLKDLSTFMDESDKRAAKVIEEKEALDQESLELAGNYSRARNAYKKIEDIIGA